MMMFLGPRLNSVGCFSGVKLLGVERCFIGDLERGEKVCLWILDMEIRKASPLILRYPDIPSNKNGLAPPSLPFKKNMESEACLEKTKLTLMAPWLLGSSPAPP